MSCHKMYRFVQDVCVKCFCHRNETDLWVCQLVLLATRWSGDILIHVSIIIMSDCCLHSVEFQYAHDTVRHNQVYFYLNGSLSIDIKFTYTINICWIHSKSKCSIWVKTTNWEKKDFNKWSYFIFLWIKELYISWHSKFHHWTDITTTTTGLTN